MGGGGSVGEFLERGGDQARPLASLRPVNPWGRIALIDRYGGIARVDGIKFPLGVLLHRSDRSVRITLIDRYRGIVYGDGGKFPLGTPGIVLIDRYRCRADRSVAGYGTGWGEMDPGGSVSRYRSARAARSPPGQIS